MLERGHTVFPLTYGMLANLWDLRLIDTGMLQFVNA